MKTGYVDFEVELPEKAMRQFKAFAELFYGGDRNACALDVIEWYMQDLQDRGIVAVRNGKLQKVNS